MPTLRVDPEAPDPRAIERAAEVLRAGGLVAFPTETVYGLGANALDADAVARIFAAKGRPAFNPLIVHVASAEAARALAARWPAAAERLAAEFWPGPLTLVVQKRPLVPDVVTAGGATVALRVPSHPVALALLRAAGVPLAAPSANRSGELSPTRAEHVEKGLGARVDLVLDGGPTQVGIESAVVDVSGAAPRLLRPGTLAPARIAAVAGALDVAGARPSGHAPRPAPGMLERHYAPRAELVLVDGADPAARADAARRARAARAAGARVAALSFGGPALDADRAVALDPRDPEGVARDLYRLLHQLDDEGFALVLAERPPADERWSGVRDRLARASAPRA